MTDSCHCTNPFTWDPRTWFQEIWKTQNAFKVFFKFEIQGNLGYLVQWKISYLCFSFSSSWLLEREMICKFSLNSIKSATMWRLPDKLESGQRTENPQDTYFFNLIGSFVPWFANLPDLLVALLTIPQTVQTSLRNSVQKKYSLVHIFSFRPEDFWASLRGIYYNTLAPPGWISCVRKYSKE